MQMFEPSSEIHQVDAKERGIAGCFSRGFNVIAAATLFSLMLFTCFDVVGRYVFNSPLTGATELTEIAIAIIVFSSLPVISWRNEHIAVDMLDRFVKGRWHIAQLFLVNNICAIALLFLGQRIYVLADRSLGYGELSEYLEIPTGYVSGFIAIMCWITAALMLWFGNHRILRKTAL